MACCVARGCVQQPGPLVRQTAVQLPPKSQVWAFPDVGRFLREMLFPQVCWHCYNFPAGEAACSIWMAQPARSPPAEQTLVKIAQRTSVKINGVVKG